MLPPQELTADTFAQLGKVCQCTITSFSDDVEIVALAWACMHFTIVNMDESKKQHIWDAVRDNMPELSQTCGIFNNHGNEAMAFYSSFLSKFRNLRKSQVS